MGISKPLQEVMYGSGDEDSGFSSNNSFNSGYFNKNELSFGTNSAFSTSIGSAYSTGIFNSRNNVEDDFDDESDDDDDDEDEIK